MLRLLVLLVLLVAQPLNHDHLNYPVSSPGGLRFLLRDADGRGVVKATLLLRTAEGAELRLLTSEMGVAESGPISEPVVWLVEAHLADGTKLSADSVPVETGFRLVVLPAQTRDVLLRVDDRYLVLDPDMVLAGEDGLPNGPTPEALSTPPATLAPLVVVAPTAITTAVEPTQIEPAAAPPVVTPAPVQPDRSSSTWWWLLALGGLALLGVVFWRSRRGRVR